jgi:hypothetical protein
VSRPRAGPEHELVYLLAGCRARREALRPAARSRLAGLDYERFARTLAERRLLPLVGSRAVDAGDELVPESFRSAVGAARAVARARGLAVEGATRRVVAALADNAIRALPLKGPLLAAEAHGDIGLRQTEDVDILVAREDLGPAVGVLRAAGFAPPSDPLRAGGLPDLHFELHHPELPTVELHWRVHWHERVFSERLLARAVPEADGLLRAQADDLVASLLLFYARDGFHGVRMASDLAGWWDRHGDDLPGRFLEPHARRHPELAPSFSAAAIAAERVTGVPARGWLGAAAVGGRRVAAAARLADWAQNGDRDQLAANISLAGALLGPRGSAPDFARRELSLPRAGPTANATHAGKLCARYAIALWRLRGGRAWCEPPAGAVSGTGREQLA